MLKIEFGKHVRSKNEMGQANGILAKCLAYLYICVLIQERFELKLLLDFNKYAEIPIAHYWDLFMYKACDSSQTLQKYRI